MKKTNTMKTHTPISLFLQENEKAEYEYDGFKLSCNMPTTWTYVVVHPADLHALAVVLDHNWPWSADDLVDYRTQPEIQSLFRTYFLWHSLESVFGDPSSL